MSSKRILQNRKPNPAGRNKAKAVVYRQRHSFAFVDCAAAFCNDENMILPKNFPVFRHEHPRLSSRFTDTFDQTYDACSYMASEDFQDAIADAVDEFLGITPEADIF